jgi:hypothetical protein
MEKARNFYCKQYVNESNHASITQQITRSRKLLLTYLFILVFIGGVHLSQKNFDIYHVYVKNLLAQSLKN